MLVRAAGWVRGLVVADNGESREDVQLNVNNRGDLLIAQALPELTELVRLGGSWYCLSAAAAPLIAVPTVAAGLSLFNNEADLGKCMAIDSFGCVEIITDAAQQNSLALFASLAPRGSPALPADAALTIASLSGRKAGTGANIRTAAGAVTLATDVWCPHAPAAPGATAFAGAVWRVTEAQVRGLYYVPPEAMFSIAAVKTVATAAQIRYFIRWHEVQMKWVA